MKIAILLLCHRKPKQINKLLCTLKNPSIAFYIHVDKKVSILNDIIQREDIVTLPDNQRVDVQWAKISQVQATLTLMNYARAREAYDFFWLCSGQDFPIKPVDFIVQWFGKHADNDFINLVPSKNNGLDNENNYDKRNAIYFPDWMLGKETHKRIVRRIYTELTGGYNKTFGFARRKPVNDLDFYFGSQWICLTGRTMDWILDYLKKHPEYLLYFENCNCPDESFFQTLVMNSPYASLRQDYLHYTDWNEEKSHPKVLTMEDYQKLMESDKLMARKFDEDEDKQIIQKLISELR